jgi:hypothetical protein
MWTLGGVYVDRPTYEKAHSGRRDRCAERVTGLHRSPDLRNVRPLDALKHVLEFTDSAAENEHAAVRADAELCLRLLSRLGNIPLVREEALEFALTFRYDSLLRAL